MTPYTPEERTIPLTFADCEDRKENIWDIQAKEFFNLCNWWPYPMKGDCDKLCEHWNCPRGFR